HGEHRTLAIEPVGDDLHVVPARGAGNLPAPYRLEAELDEHARGGRIVDEVRGGEARQPRVAEPVAHHGARGLRRIAPSPPRPSQPEAELGGARWPAIVAGPADQPALALDREARLAAHRLSQAMAC